MAGSLSCPSCWAPFHAGEGVDSVTLATGAPAADRAGGQRDVAAGRHELGERRENERNGHRDVVWPPRPVTSSCGSPSCARLRLPSILDRGGGSLGARVEVGAGNGRGEPPDWGRERPGVGRRPSSFDDARRAAAHPDRLLAFRRWIRGTGRRPLKTYRGVERRRLPRELRRSSMPAAEVLSGRRAESRTARRGSARHAAVPCRRCHPGRPHGRR